MGVMMRTWAITIACNEKRSPQEPNGPRRIRRRYTTRPATTGGVPMRVRQSLTTIRFPGKRLLSKKKPRMLPSADAIKVEARDILRVTAIISRVSELKLIKPRKFNLPTPNSQFPTPYYQFTPALGVKRAPPNSATPYPPMITCVESFSIQSTKACPPSALIPGCFAGFTAITP